MKQCIGKGHRPYMPSSSMPLFPKSPCSPTEKLSELYFWVLWRLHYIRQWLNHWPLVIDLISSSSPLPRDWEGHWMVSLTSSPHPSLLSESHLVTELNKMWASRLGPIHMVPWCKTQQCWKERIFIYNIPTLGGHLQHSFSEPGFPIRPSISHAPHQAMIQKTQ